MSNDFVNKYSDFAQIFSYIFIVWQVNYVLSLVDYRDRS